MLLVLKNPRHLKIGSRWRWLPLLLARTFPSQKEDGGKAACCWLLLVLLLLLHNLHIISHWVFAPFGLAEVFCMPHAWCGTSQCVYKVWNIACSLGLLKWCILFAYVCLCLLMFAFEYIQHTTHGVRSHNLISSFVVIPSSNQNWACS